jgi:hypothetical protein
VEIPLELQGFPLKQGHLYRFVAYVTTSDAPPAMVDQALRAAGFVNDLHLWEEEAQLPGDWPAQPGASGRTFPYGTTLNGERYVRGQGTWARPDGYFLARPISGPSQAVLIPRGNEVHLLDVWEHSGAVAPPKKVEPWNPAKWLLSGNSAVEETLSGAKTALILVAVTAVALAVRSVSK